MARIPDEEIELLKAEVSVERLAEAKGVELRRHGTVEPWPRVAGDHHGDDRRRLERGIHPGPEASW